MSNAEDLREKIAVIEEMYLEACKASSFNEGKLKGLEFNDINDGWKDEALEWREVAIPFIKKHLGL